jgi:membrane-associated phospholipid phosphatase
MNVMTSDAASWDTWVADADAIAAMIEVPTEAARDVDAQELLVLAQDRNPESLAQVRYWNAAAPSYRWMEVVNDTYKNGAPNPLAGRAFTLVNIAIYDAVITTYKAKPMDSRVSPVVHDELEVLVPVHGSSFPSEHAAAAIAASEVLAYLNPDNADMFRAMAAAAIDSRLVAGANFRSDLDAGRAIGEAVAAQVIAVAMQDGSDTPWEYTKPEGSLFATGNPVFPMTGNWQTWAIDNGQQFRVAAPPAYDSAEIAADLAELKAVEPILPNIQQASYWATFYTSNQIWYDFASKQLFEQRQADNAPLMALIYSGIGVAQYDAVVGCFDSKYAYVYARPSHIDAEITPLFGPPPHPSYPSAHSCSSTAQATVAAHFFPHVADDAFANARAAGQSRILAGIHYQIDNTAGTELGANVGEVVIETLQAMTQ